MAKLRIWVMHPAALAVTKAARESAVRPLGSARSQFIAGYNANTTMLPRSSGVGAGYDSLSG